MRHRQLSVAPLAVCFFLLLPTLALAQNLRFTTLDIGQGDAAVLVAPGGCAVLFDGGPTGSGTTIKAYLKSIGVTRVQMAFVSHLHADHMGGIDEVDVGTDAVPIDAVYDHGGTYSSATYDEYAAHFAGKRNTASAGQTFTVCNQVTLRVIAAGGSSTDENGKSVVVKISYGAFDALVGGDLTGVTPDIETGISSLVGEIELYKVHHHGSRTSSNATFLGATLPIVSFISVGVGNTYGHPTSECLARLANVGSEVWQTEDPATSRKDGHIELTSATGASFTVTQGTTSVVYASKGSSADTQPPTAPGALVATAAASTTDIDLSWTASTDNVGVTGYNVYRSTNGNSFSLAGTTSTPGFSDLGLSGGTTYWYQVTATDAAGNASPVSNTASATTVTPVRSLAITSPNGGESWSGGNSRAITWTSSSVSNVKLEYTLNNGTSWTVIASSVAASTGSYTWTVPNTASTQARVRATDALNGTPVDTSDGVFTITSSSPAKVILNEILANEPGSSTAGEFVEVVNVGGTSINIGGWKITVGGTVRHTFATGTTLEAGKGIVVFAGASGIPAGTPNAVTASTGGLSLLNSSATVAVKNGNTTINSFSYSSSLAGTDGVSMNRSPDTSATGSFVLHTTLSSLSASPGERVNGSAF